MALSGSRAMIYLIQLIFAFLIVYYLDVEFVKNSVAFYTIFGIDVAMITVFVFYVAKEMSKAFDF
jgi:cell division protein FtsW (lipid II flippase)